MSLYNENTFELSTTNLIAKKSEVLEGSLWYHFNSKQDLVSVHTELFLDSFRKKRIYTEKNDPKELILGLLSIYEVLWDYRYLVRDSFEQFSNENPKLCKKIVEPFFSARTPFSSLPDSSIGIDFLGCRLGMERAGRGSEFCSHCRETINSRGGGGPCS